MTSSMALFSRIFEYLDLPITITDPAHPKPVPAGAGRVRFDAVSFSYPDTDQPTLDQIDLDIPGGSSLAIVGATGSVGSCVVRLLADEPLGSTLTLIAATAASTAACVRPLTITRAPSPASAAAIA